MAEGSVYYHLVRLVYLWYKMDSFYCTYSKRTETVGKVRELHT